MRDIQFIKTIKNINTFIFRWYVCDIPSVIDDCVINTEDFFKEVEYSKTNGFNTKLILVLLLLVLLLKTYT